MAKINASTVTSNMMWRFMERIGAQLVSFGVSILLARLLSPDDYGVVAIIMSIMAILQIFVDSGLGNALIQKKNVEDEDYSTVFVFNTVMCIGKMVSAYVAFGNRFEIKINFYRLFSFRKIGLSLYKWAKANGVFFLFVKKLCRNGYAVHRRKRIHNSV